MTETPADEAAGAPVTFTVRYTSEHCLATAWRYWQRRMGLRYALEVAIGVGLLLLATQGPYRWLEVAIMIAVGFFALLGAGHFFLHWHRALQGMRALDPPQSTWILAEEGIGQKSSLGESAAPWKNVREVWRFDDLWLLVWGRDVYSTIPLDQLPRGARQMIERRVREAGGKIR